MNAGLEFALLPPFVTVKLGYKYSKDVRDEEYVKAVETVVQDPKIRSLLDDETKTRKVVKQQLEAVAELAEAYKQEARTILEAAANFTNFLKENAILFGTDPLESYMKSLVEE